MFHPWRSLPAHVRVDFASLPPPLRGATDGCSRIVLHNRLEQVERRCTLEHEKVHIDRGDMGKCRPEVERSIDRTVARRMIPLDALMSAMAWTDQMPELAAELWVTEQIAAARLESLLPAEVAIISELIADLRTA